MNKKCLNCGFIDELETLKNAWGELEADQQCRKCGSKAYKVLEEEQQ